MAKYVYESIQGGLFNFTIPGENKSVQLFKGSKVTLDQQLSGGYLRVLKLVKIIPDEPSKEETPKKVTTKPKAKVADKIIKVEEVVESVKEEVVVESKDEVVAVKEEEVVVEPQVDEVKEEPKSTPAKKTTTRKTTVKKPTTPRKRRTTTRKASTNETPKSE